MSGCGETKTIIIHDESCNQKPNCGCTPEELATTIPIVVSGPPQEAPTDCESRIAFDPGTGCFYVWIIDQWVKSTCPSITLPYCDVIDQSDIVYCLFNSNTGEDSVIVEVSLSTGTYQILKTLDTHTDVNALAYDGSRNIFYFFSATFNSVFSYNPSLNLILQVSPIDNLPLLPLVSYDLGAYDNVLDRYIIGSRDGQLWAINVPDLSASLAGDIDLSLLPQPAPNGGADIHVDSCGNLYVFLDNNVWRFENYDMSSQIEVGDIENNSGTDFSGGFGKQESLFVGFYDDKTLFKNDFLLDSISVIGPIVPGGGEPVYSGNDFDITDMASSGASSNIKIYLTFDTDDNCNTANILCANLPDGSFYQVVGSLVPGSCDDQCENEIIAPPIFDDPIEAFVCITPSVEEPRLPPGPLPSPLPPPETDLGNVVLDVLSISDAEQMLGILVKSIFGGDGGPYDVDFSNVSFTTFIRQTTPSVIDRTGPPEVILVNDTGVVSGSGVASMDVKVRTDGAYDPTEDGQAGIEILAGSYVTISDQSGNTADFYIPTGSEGNIVCGSFDSDQGNYIDEWLIIGFGGQSGGPLTGRVCIAPSTSNLGGPNPADGGQSQLTDVILPSADISPAEQTLYIVLDQVTGGDGGPYTVDFNFVNYTTEILEGVTDRTGAANVSMAASAGSLAAFPGGSAYAYMSIQAVSDGSYDTQNDGTANITVSSSVVTISDGSGNSIQLFVPGGNEGNANCGTHTFLQPPYSDSWNIVGFDPLGDPGITAELCFWPSDGLPVHPVTMETVPDFPIENTHRTCDLSTDPITECERELLLAVQNISGGDGGPYVVDFSNVTWSGEVLEDAGGPGEISRLTGLVIDTDPGVGAVPALGLTWQSATLDIDEVGYDTTKDGFAWLRADSGSYITITDASLNTVDLYIPDGRNGAVSCETNTVDQGDYYEDNFIILGTDASFGDILATLYISPSLGDPGTPGPAGSDTELFSPIVDCSPDDGSRKIIYVSIQNITGGDGGPYTVDFSNLVFDYLMEQECPGIIADQSGPITPEYFNYTGATTNPVRTNVPSGQGQSGGDVVPYAQGRLPNAPTNDTTTLITLGITGSVEISDGSGNTITLYVPQASEGNVAGTAFTTPQGKYVDSYEIECPTCVPV